MLKKVIFIIIGVLIVLAIAIFLMSKGGVDIGGGFGGKYIRDNGDGSYVIFEKGNTYFFQRADGWHWTGEYRKEDEVITLYDERKIGISEVFRKTASGALIDTSQLRWTKE